MESATSMASVIEHEAPSSYYVDPAVENLIEKSPFISSEKKKRGRPRKYGPGESIIEEKRVIVAPISNSKKKMRNKIGFENLDDWDECSTGGSFLPHIIIVNPGEDIFSKMMEFSLRGPRSVCIISANGVLSKVTIQHPGSSGGTLTYEGQFEIISFRGSFETVELPDSKFDRSGVIGMSLSGPDGRILGGLLAGPTIAAGRVEVVVGSYLPSSQLELKPKKQKMESFFNVNGSSQNVTPHPVVDKRNFNCSQETSNSTTDNTINWASTQTAENLRKSTADINISLKGEF